MPAPIKRQNTQWIVDGQVIFNGNPNGNRLLSRDDDDLLSRNDGKTDDDGNPTQEYLDFIEKFCKSALVDTEMSASLRGIYAEMLDDIRK